MKPATHPIVKGEKGFGGSFDGVGGLTGRFRRWAKVCRVALEALFRVHPEGVHPVGHPEPTSELQYRLNGS